MVFEIIKFLPILAIIVILIWLLIDAMNAVFRKPYLKVIWILVLTFLPVIGMAAYYFYGRKQKMESKD